MKFQVQMKDPDTLYDAIREANVKDIGQNNNGLDSDEKVALFEMRNEKLSALCQKWFEYGEYLTVEIDTEEKTCVVVARS